MHFPNPLQVRLLGACVAALLVLTACGRKADEARKPVQVQVATMETDLGTIEFELLPDVAPKTVENFRLLSEKGYYDGLKVFRIVKDFMIQTGDPKNDGRGGESAWGGTFNDEIDRTSPLYRGGYKRGTVAMANAGPNTNNSQFFIVQKDYPLHPGFTIFGRVTRGMEVVDKMAELPMERGIDGGMSKPVNMPVVKKIRVAEVLRMPGQK